MNKKAIIITENGKVIDVIELKTFTDESSFLVLCKEAKKNKAERDYVLNKKLELKDRFIKAKNHEHDLQITLLKNEIKLLKGEISDKEYDENYKMTSKLLKEYLEEFIKIESEAREYGLE